MGSLLFARHGLAVHYHVFFVELFVATLPSVVGPEIVSWFAADGLFEELEEASGEFVLFPFCRIARDKVERGCVISSLGSFKVDVEHGVIHLSHDAFCTRKHSCVVIEEVQP